jgi:hypothetical protein
MNHLAVAVIVLEKPSDKLGQSSCTDQSNGKTRYKALIFRSENQDQMSLDLSPTCKYLQISHALWSAYNISKFWCCSISSLLRVQRACKIANFIASFFLDLSWGGVRISLPRAGPKMGKRHTPFSYESISTSGIIHDDFPSNAFQRINLSIQRY